MNNFKIGDWFRCKDIIGNFCYGEVYKISESTGEIEGYDLSKPKGTVWARAEEAEPVEPLFVDAESIRRFARYEIPAREFLPEDFVPELLKPEIRQTLTFDDLIAVFQKANGMSLTKLEREWYRPLIFMYEAIYSGRYEENDDDADNYMVLPTKSLYIWRAIEETGKHIDEGNNDFTDLIYRMEFFKGQTALPVPERQYSNATKRKYLEFFRKKENLRTASAKEMELYEKFVDELAEIGDRTARKLQKKRKKSA